MYAYDILGRLSSPYLKVCLTIGGLTKGEKITIIDRVYGGDPNSITMLEGPSPTKAYLNDSEMVVEWHNITASSSTIVIKYRTKILLQPRIEVTGLLNLEEGRLDEELYMVKDFKEGASAKITIIIKVVNSTSLPYIVTIIFPLPEKFAEAKEFEPKPNATSVQEDNNIYYWNILLTDNSSISTEFVIKSLGAWKSLWLPPVTIQVVDDPWTILKEINKTGIEETYNELLNMRNNLTKYKNEFEKDLENMDNIINTLRFIGSKEIQASKALANISKSIRQLRLLGESESEELEKILNEARNKTKNASDILPVSYTHLTLPTTERV